MFKFSVTYKENVVIVSLITVILCAVVYAISVIPTKEQFVYSVAETNQPNCVVGAYVMFAKETLDKELLIGDIKHDYPVFTNAAVGIGCVKPYWDEMFPTNRLKCVYNDTNTNTYNLSVKWSVPYIWTGQWYVNTNEDYHTCLVYFHPDFVIFKHFVYNPKTHYNYEVRTNYDFFFSRTIRLYQLK